MNDFLSGAIMMGFAVGGLFFCRYYRRTRDRLFAIFGAAFFIMSLNRWMIVTLSPAGDEVWVLFYLVRLLAFVLILLAILDKNRGSRGARV